MIYYIYKNNMVYGSTENEELVDDIAISLGVEDYEVGTTAYGDYSPNNNKYILENGVIILNPNYEAELEAKEKARIAEIALTRADVFEALILARGLTKQMLRAYIENDETLNDIEKALYLNRFDDALEFYRKHPAIDFISEKLGISTDDMDKFFDTKDYNYLKPVVNNDPNTENENVDGEGVEGDDLTHNDPNVTHGEEITDETDVNNSEPIGDENPVVEDIPDVEDVNNLEDEVNNE